MTETSTDNWSRVASLGDIPDARGLATTAAGTELALFKVGDRVYCLEDNCPHRGAALSEGTILNGEIVCPWHGWRFALDNGECSTLPGSMSAKCFEVRVDGDDVHVKL